MSGVLDSDHARGLVGDFIAHLGNEGGRRVFRSARAPVGIRLGVAQGSAKSESVLKDADSIKARHQYNCGAKGTWGCLAAPLGEWLEMSQLV